MLEQFSPFLLSCLVFPLGGLWGFLFFVCSVSSPNWSFKSWQKISEFIQSSEPCLKICQKNSNCDTVCVCGWVCVCVCVGEMCVCEGEGGWRRVRECAPVF